MNRRRRFYLICGILVALIGVASRVAHSGVLAIDKYLGDAQSANTKNIESRSTMLPQAISTFEWPPRKPC